MSEQKSGSGGETTMIMIVLKLLVKYFQVVDW